MLKSYKDDSLMAIQLTQKCTSMLLQLVTPSHSRSITENNLSSNEFASLISLISSWTEMSWLDKQEDS